MSNVQNTDVLLLPIMDTRVGTVAFRRALSAAGFKTLKQAFDTDEDNVDRILSFDDADMLYELKDAYKKNPTGFTKKYAVRRAAVKPTRGTNTQATKVEVASRTRRTQTVRHQPAKTPVSQESYILPIDDLGKTLAEYELRAKEALDELADRDDDYLVFEVFDDFATELNKVRVAVAGLFRRYKSKPSLLIPLIAANIPNLYLLFISDLTREQYDGQMLWGHLFKTIGVTDSGQETQYKRLFVDLLERRGMPTYAKGEKDFYYLYTALLHGGLSNVIWEDLWKKSLLPLAKRASDDPYRFGQSLDGHSILELIRQPESTYTPRKSVLGILDKVPQRTIAPVLDNALRVARDLSGKTERTVFMVRTHGLPMAALESLQSVRNQDNSETKNRRGVGGERSKNHGIMPIQEGTLLLDLTRGHVTIVWKPQAIPEEFVGYRVEFYIDGDLRETKEVLQGFGTAVLDRVSITMQPQPTYSVEIKLKRPIESSRGVKFVEVGSLDQSFERVHAGCFEFIETMDGQFRLRNKRDRIRRTRNIAYILKEERDIRPGAGMQLIERRSTAGDWGGRTIHLYKVEPGASGEVVSKSDGTILSAWHESYGTTVKRENVIGYTGNGLDLYGVVRDQDQHNAMLPDIVIESADNQAAAYDLDIEVSCDGALLDVPMLGAISYDGLGEENSSVVVRLSEIDGIPYYANECVVSVRQRSTNQMVCRYRFAVAPIERFRLSYIRATDFTATYVFRMAISASVTCDGESCALKQGSSYYFQRPLACDNVSMEFSCDNSAMPLNVRLGLVGIEVQISNSLREQSLLRPINAFDAIDLEFEDELVIRTSGNRSNRVVALRYGDDFLLYGKEQRHGDHRFSLFADPSVFSLWGNYESREFTLELFVSFNMDALVDETRESGASITLLRLERGLGIGGISLLADKGGQQIVRFESPTTADLYIEFFVDFSHKDTYRSGKTKYRTGKCDIEAGATSVPVPRGVAQDIRFDRHVTMKLYPMNEFGSPDEDFSMELTINEG